ncbi:MAG TPA: hypothetical protein VEY87_01715 [Gaiellaceae bacterium]|nr:hypothetical protein [Gaiellaceae bacterium]
MACVAVGLGTAGAAGAAVPVPPATLALSALTGNGSVLTIEAPVGVASFEHVHVGFAHPPARRSGRRG